jgi:hypothetical protein
MREGGTDTSTEPTVTNAGAPVATAAPPVVTPPIVVTKKSPVVIDSATRARRMADRQRKDSIRALTRAAIAASAAPAVASPGSVEAAVNRYARGIESMTVDRLKEAYPGLTDDQQKSWENVWAKTTKVRATVTQLNVSMLEKDVAEASFRLNVSYVDATGSPTTMPPSSLRATLKHSASGWQIDQIH